VGYLFIFTEKLISVKFAEKKQHGCRRVNAHLSRQQKDKTNVDFAEGTLRWFCPLPQALRTLVTPWDLRQRVKLLQWARTHTENGVADDENGAQCFLTGGVFRIANHCDDDQC